MKLLRDILTGIDKESYDSGRVLCFLSYVVYFFLAINSSFHGHPWTALDFSGGASAMAVGFGFNLKLKSDTEPKCS